LHQNDKVIDAVLERFSELIVALLFVPLKDTRPFDIVGELFKVALYPFPLRSAQTVPLPGYDFGSLASSASTSPFVTMLGE
jgi:hypothetical protein